MKKRRKFKLVDNVIQFVEFCILDLINWLKLFFLMFKRDYFKIA